MGRREQKERGRERGMGIERLWDLYRSPPLRSSVYIITSLPIVRSRLRIGRTASEVWRAELEGGRKVDAVGAGGLAIACR